MVSAVSLNKPARIPLALCGLSLPLAASGHLLLEKYGISSVGHCCRWVTAVGGSLLLLIGEGLM